MNVVLRHRFDEIWSELRWSDQPDVRPPEMSHADYRWLLVDDMVEILIRIEKIHSSHQSGFVLMSQSHGGMG